jgi:glycosyltransferase involved in cell wall biosynthesis
VNEPTGAVFVMPRRDTEWGNAAALWVTAAGWADAARRRFGMAWVVSPGGVVSPDTALGHTRPRPEVSGGHRGAWLPTDVGTALKDLGRRRKARAFSDAGEPPEWKDERLAFVWQHHDLFHDAGRPVARRHGCPLVSYVHAPQVWEARRWGVHRRGYGRWLERVAERPQLRASDVVCCVSEEVATELERFGIERGKILVSPMAVDARRFSPEVSGVPVRERHGLGVAFTVGWVGTFRTFHGVDSVIDAFRLVHRVDSTARLLLAGSGSELPAMRERARKMGLSAAVVFAGAVANVEMPEYVAAMDAAIVSARPGDDFHYSPLKLREYLACSRAVVAPRLGEVPRTLIEGEQALLYEPGDVDELAAQLTRLSDDPELRKRLGSAGRDLAVRTSTWDVRLRDLIQFDAFDSASQ